LKLKVSLDIVKYSQFFFPVEGVQRAQSP